MKICVGLVLLMLLCPGGCPVYDFDLRTVEQPSQFANGLKLAADLNSEFNQGMMNFHVLNDKERFDVEDTCKLDGISDEPVEGPTRKLKYLRRAEEEDISNMELNEFVGSNLFDSTRKNCFSPEDLNLLAARRDFEYLLPKDLPKCLLNDDMLNMLLNYFYNGNEFIQRMNEVSRKVVERAYYDMLGGYLRSYMLPVAKYSFYGGKVSLKVVSSVVELYQQCKSFLNTNGNGWKMPILLEEMENVRVDSIRGSDCGADGNGAGGGPTGCARLEMLPASDGDENVMLVSLPKLEADCVENGLSNIWLPFRKRRNYDLRSQKSAYIILRFYETVTRCYQSQSMPQEAFNCKFIAWINENLKPHLSDEEFYPGLGGVLRIVEKLRKGRKALDMDDDEALNQGIEDLSGTRMGDTGGVGVGDSKSDDGFSDMELAQKALEYKMKESARKTMINSKRWFEKNSNDNRQLQSRKICEKSKGQQSQHGPQIHQNQTHKGKKPKCKTKGGKHGGAGSLITLTSEEQKHYLKYLCCIIGLILLILLIILLVAMLLRYRKRTRKTEPKPKPPKKKRKCPAWCRFLLCRKKPRDEEIVIKPETKSVIATQPHRRASTSTSSLACQPAAKCIPCSKRATKESESAPIIETTSLDYYSSSEPESKVRQKAKKGKQKVVTIDEKKKKKSASPSPTKTKSSPAKSKAATPKSRLGGGAELKSSSSSDSTKRLGIQRTIPTDNKKSSNEEDTPLLPQPECPASRDHSKGSRSWETMYDT